MGKGSAFGNKLNNTDFLNSIKKCDIAILSEIWGIESLNLPGFDIIELNSPKKLKTKRTGRNSGGILIAVKR